MSTALFLNTDKPIPKSWLKKKKILTNLQYLQEFLTETYGAICFYNDIKDGYTLFPENDSRRIETLSVYFPNKLDLQNNSVKERLEEAVGTDFYDRYIGAKEIKLCPLNGSVLIAQFSKDGQILGITIDKNARRLVGGVFDVIQYFIGNDIEGRRLARPNNFQQEIQTNNGFCIKTGAYIKDCIEAFLKNNGLPLVSKENGFYIAETEEIKVESESKIYKYNTTAYLKTIQLSFEKEMNAICLLRQNREKEFQNSLVFMTKDDWGIYKKAMGIDALPPVRNEEFKD